MAARRRRNHQGGLPRPGRRRRPRTSFINVRIGTLPGRIRDYVLNGGRSVEKALEVASLSLEEESQIRVNGEVAGLQTNLKEGDCLLLIEAIEGN